MKAKKAATSLITLPVTLMAMTCEILFVWPVKAIVKIAKR